MTPLEAMLLSKPSDPKMQKAFADGLRRRKQIGQVAQLTGLPDMANFGSSVLQDVQHQTAERGKQEQRELLKSYYDQQAETSRAAQAHRGSVLQETIRHHKAMEGRYVAQAGKEARTAKRNLSRELIKANIPEMNQDMIAVDKILKKYEGKDLPGVGRVMSGVSPKLLGEDAQEVRTTVAMMESILLKALSGAAVTDPEYRRFEKAFALGLGFSEKNFLKAWGRLKERIQAKEAAIMSGYEPEIQEAYLDEVEAYYARIRGETGKLLDDDGSEGIDISELMQ